jgi:hypothetical protein
LAGAAKARLKSAVKPVVRPVSRRLEDLHEHLDNDSVSTQRHLSTIQGQLDVIDLRDQVTNDHVAALMARLLKLEERVRVDAEVLGEFARVSRRTVDRLDDRLDEIASVADGSFYDKLLQLDPYFADRAIGGLTDTDLHALGPGAAEYLNWAIGLTGPAAQAGLLFTDPVTTTYRPGGYEPVWVNERIVEVPYALGVLAELAAPSRVLDFGACFSTFALSAASLGHHVTALDLHPYPLRHPNLTVVTAAGEDWEGPEQPFDAIVALSTVEHLGLGAYGDSPSGPGLDAVLMSRFRTWLGEGGKLVFTAPYGPWEVGSFQRVYDDAHLDALFTGWKIADQRFYVQEDPLVWMPHAGPPALSPWHGTKRAVVLITAFATGEA